VDIANARSGGANAAAIDNLTTKIAALTTAMALAGL